MRKYSKVATMRPWHQSHTRQRPKSSRPNTIPKNVPKKTVAPIVLSVFWLVCQCFWVVAILGRIFGHSLFARGWKGCFPDTTDPAKDSSWCRHGPQGQELLHASGWAQYDQYHTRMLPTPEVAENKQATLWYATKEVSKHHPSVHHRQQCAHKTTTMYLSVRDRTPYAGISSYFLVGEQCVFGSGHPGQWGLVLFTATPGDFDLSWCAASRVERQDLLGPCVHGSEWSSRRFKLFCTSCLQRSRQHHPAPLRVFPESSKVLQKDSIMTSLEVRPVPRKLSAKCSCADPSSVSLSRMATGTMYGICVELVVLCALFIVGTLRLHRHGNMAFCHHGHVNDPWGFTMVIPEDSPWSLVCSLHCEHLLAVAQLGDPPLRQWTVPARRHCLVNSLNMGSCLCVTAGTCSSLCAYGANTVFWTLWNIGVPSLCRHLNVPPLRRWTAPAALPLFSRLWWWYGTESDSEHLNSSLYDLNCGTCLSTWNGNDAPDLGKCGTSLVDLSSLCVSSNACACTSPQVRRTRPRPDSKKQSLSHLSCHVVSDTRDAVCKTSRVVGGLVEPCAPLSCQGWRSVLRQTSCQWATHSPLAEDGHHCTVGANRDPLVCKSLSSVHDGHSVSPCCAADVVLCRVRVRCRHNCACTPNIKGFSPRAAALKYTCTLLKFSLGLIDQEELARLLPGALVGFARVLLLSIIFCCQLCDSHMLTLHPLVPPGLLQDVAKCWSIHCHASRSCGIFEFAGRVRSSCYSRKRVWAPKSLSSSEKSPPKSVPPGKHELVEQVEVLLASRHHKKKWSEKEKKKTERPLQKNGWHVCSPWKVYKKNTRRPSLPKKWCPLPLPPSLCPFPKKVTCPFFHPLSKSKEWRVVHPPKHGRCLRWMEAGISRVFWSGNVFSALGIRGNEVSCFLPPLRATSIDPGVLRVMWCVQDLLGPFVHDIEWSSPQLKLSCTSCLQSTCEHPPVPLRVCFWTPQSSPHLQLTLDLTRDSTGCPSQTVRPNAHARTLRPWPCLAWPQGHRLPCQCAVPVSSSWFSVRFSSWEPGIASSREQGVLSSRTYQRSCRCTGPVGSPWSCVQSALWRIVFCCLSLCHCWNRLQSLHLQCERSGVGQAGQTVPPLRRRVSGKSGSGQSLGHRCPGRTRWEAGWRETRGVQQSHGVKMESFRWGHATRHI